MLNKIEDGDKKLELFKDNLTNEIQLLTSKK